MYTESSRYEKSNNSLKIIAIICFLISILALISTRNVPATAYEASIYAATPKIFWLAISLNVICGTFLIVQQIYTRQHLKSNLWVIGFLLLFLAFASLVTLWIIRGYANWGTGDPMTHVMLTNYIISNHHVSLQDFYPITHILTAEISYIINIPVVALYGYIPIIFNAMYLIFMYVFAKAILSSKGAIIVTIILAMVTIIGFSNGNIYFAPNSLADLYLPFALYLFVKSSPSGTTLWKILFIFVVFLYPPFHPVPSLALLLIMATITLANIFYGILRKRDLSLTRGVFNFRLAVILFLLFWSIIWFSSTNLWVPTINNLRLYFSGQGTNQLTTLNQLIQKAQQFQYSPLLEFFKVYGGLLIFAVISLATLVVLLKKALYEIEQKNLLSLFGPVAIIAFFIIVFYLLNLGFSPLRLIAYIALILTILTGFSLNKLLEQSYTIPKGVFHNWVFSGLVFFIIIATFTGSALELYPSSYILQGNDQITRTNLQGMDWFFDYRNSTYVLSTITLIPYRYADYLLSPQDISQQTNLTPIIVDKKDDITVPWHFGYDETDELGDWYNQKAYLLIDTTDRVLYQQIFPEMQNIRYTPEDFDRLNQDPSLAKLYSNGGLDIYSVTPVP
jgi:hypothetical protein